MPARGGGGRERGRRHERVAYFRAFTLTILPINALALSMAAQKGIYALLLGSGVSRASQIPTGWDIVLDLIRKLSQTRGADCGSDPLAWYRGEFGSEPGYSTLLEKLAPSQAARTVLLRGYFEPNELESERGEKQPSAAHRAIAKLVRAGHVRVVVTTNFDRLLERAVSDEGVEPVVIATPNQAAGAFPFQHSACTIIKLHGDYLDSRLKNTTDELARYELVMRKLLDRVFDEFGLIVCGWSAEWDSALRSRLESRQNRRFPSYWVDVRKLAGRSDSLALHLRAQRIEDAAEKFFPVLGESVVAVEDSAAQHPANADVAAARLKRLIVVPADRIRLHDLVMDETKRLRAVLMDSPIFSSHPSNRNPEGFLKVADTYVNQMSTLLAMAVEGTRWGNSEQHDLWAAVFDTLLEDEREPLGTSWAVRLWRLPSLLFLYVVGLGTLVSRCPSRYSLLARLVDGGTVRRGIDRTAAVETIVPTDVLDQSQWQGTSEFTRDPHPSSQFLYERLRPVLLRLTPSVIAASELFDRWECLLSVILIARRRRYYGRYVSLASQDGSTAYNALVREFRVAGAKWEPIAAGLFNEDAATRAFDQMAKVSEERRW